MNEEGECIRCGAWTFFLHTGVCKRCSNEAHLVVCSACARLVHESITEKGVCACCRGKKAR
jgi:hypothetical protein